MELIGKQIAIETILGQPPELHYPSWYAAQIEKLPPAPPEYLAEQAGILVTDADTISRAKAIEALWEKRQVLNDYMEILLQDGKMSSRYLTKIERNRIEEDINIIEELPPAQPERIKGHWILAKEQRREDTENDNYMYNCSNCDCGDLHSKAVKVSYCWNCGAEMEVTT